MATFAGVLLMQLAWIITLPAFGGMDEFDHVFKATSVARGHLRAGATTDGGRGGQVVAPQDVVQAASAICASYPYTGRDNCHPVKQLGHGNVTVDSGAASYNPVYYAVAGTIARPFHGASVDFVARIVTSVLTALLLAWAAVVTRRRTASSWPPLALLLVVTPTLIYSSAVTSPNGVGYAAGILVWSAATWFVDDDVRPPVAAFVTGCLALLVSHSTAVVWLAVIAVAVLSLRPRAAWAGWIGRNRRAASWAAGVVAMSALACLAWIVTQKTNSLEYDDSVVRHSWPSLPAMVGQWVVWCFQTIGAFPIRDEPAPLIVYPMWLVPFFVLMVLGWKAAARRVRFAMVLVGLAWLLIPTAATIKSYAALGYAWQGRYALPLAVGLPILAAMTLAAHRRSASRRTVVGVVAMFALVQAICVCAVALKGQRAEYAPTLVPGTPGALVAVVLALGGALLLARGLFAHLLLPGAPPAPAPVPTALPEPAETPASPVGAK